MILEGAYVVVKENERLSHIVSLKEGEAAHENHRYGEGEEEKGSRRH